MTHEDAIKLLRASGYKVTKPRVKVTERPTLNCLGLPMSAQYDPNYKRRMPLTSITRLYAPYGYAMRWVQS